VELYLHASVNSALARDEPGRFTSGAIVAHTHWVGGRTDSIPGLNSVVKRKYLAGIERRSPSPQPVTVLNELLHLTRKEGRVKKSMRERKYSEKKRNKCGMKKINQKETQIREGRFRERSREAEKDGLRM
jgi:hypothetical protein